MRPSVLVLALVLAGCPHGGSAGGSGGFRVFYPVDRALLKTHFQVKPSATCTYEDGRDAHWSATGARLEGGELPPGLDLEDGAINGAPTKTGTFTAKLLVTGVSCAGKTQPDQHVEVTITVF